MLSKLDQQRLFSSSDYDVMRRLLGPHAFRHIVWSFPLNSVGDFDYFFGEYGIVSMTLSGLMEDHYQEPELLIHALRVVAQFVSHVDLQAVFNPDVSSQAALDVLQDDSNPMSDVDKIGFFGYCNRIETIRADWNLEIDYTNAELSQAVLRLHGLVNDSTDRDLLYDTGFLNQHADQLAITDDGVYEIVGPDDEDGDGVHFCYVRLVGALQKQLEASPGNLHSRMSPPSVAEVEQVATSLRKVMELAQHYQVLKQFNAVVDQMQLEYYLASNRTTIDFPLTYQALQNVLFRYLRTGLHFSAKDKLNAVLCSVVTAIERNDDAVIELALNNVLTALKSIVEQAGIDLVLSGRRHSAMEKAMLDQPIIDAARQWRQRRKAPKIAAYLKGHSVRAQLARQSHVSFMANRLLESEVYIPVVRKLALKSLRSMSKADVPNEVCSYDLINELARIKLDYLSRNLMPVLKYIGFERLDRHWINGINRLCERFDGDLKALQRLITRLPSGVLNASLLAKLASQPVAQLNNGYFQAALRRTLLHLKQDFGMTACGMAGIHSSWFASEDSMRALRDSTLEAVLGLVATKRRYQPRVRPRRSVATSRLCGSFDHALRAVAALNAERAATQPARLAAHPPKSRP